MNGQTLDSWHSGTGKVLRVGDVVAVGSSSKLRRILSIVERPSGNVDVTTGPYTKVSRARDNGLRIFHPDVLTTNRRKTDEAHARDLAAAELKKKTRAS